MLFRSPTPLGISSFIEKVTRSHAATGLGTFTNIESTSEISAYTGIGTIAVVGGSDVPAYYGTFGTYYDDYGAIIFGVSDPYDDYGSVSDIINYPYVDYGSLGRFTFVESLTRSYTRNSIGLANDTPADYGLVSASVDSQDDLGILPGILLDEDYGTLAPIAAAFIEDNAGISTSLTISPTDSTWINTSSFDKVSVQSNGSGSGSTGGFAIGTHLKFGTVPQVGIATRSFSSFPVDATVYKNIVFSAIKGNGLNGGEEPDVTEDLKLYFSTDNGSTFTFISIIVGEADTTFNTLKNVSIPVPIAARQTNTIFKVQQDSSSGSVNDHYGINNIIVEFTNTVTYEDLGTIPNATIEGVFGPVADYGFLLPVPTTPYGTINISSGYSALTKIYSHLASGGLVVSRPTPLGISSFIENVTRSHAATGIGTFTSIENTSAIRSYVGSGLIDVTGGYNPYDDYGLIRIGVTGQYVDYGFLVDYKIGRAHV